MRIKRQFAAEERSISTLTEFVRENLEKYGIKKKERVRVMLAVEEAAGSLLKHNIVPEYFSKGHIYVTVKAFLGNVEIEISAKGEEYSLANDMASATLNDPEDQVDDIQERIRNIILGSVTDNIKYRHKNGINYIRMTVIRSKQAFLYQTLGAMALAVIVGLIFSSVFSEDMNKTLNSMIFSPVKTMYMNALKMIVAPVVFFSIISCIVQFSDLSALGRIGGKIFGMYLFTTGLAVAVGIGIFSLIKPGDASLATSLIADASAITSQEMNVSIKDTIVGIIPSDIINPFLKADMLQLIFMAVLCGVATGLLGKYSDTLTELFSACNDLFLKVTTMIIKVMPIAVFCSIMSMMLTMGIKTIISVLGMFGTFILGLLSMMVVYCLLMVIIGRLNPIPFIRKYAPSMLQVFSLASSNASIPVNMDACEKKIGISKKIFSLSIPLGATLNMDGTCVHLAVFALALAKTYGVEITGSAMLSMIISIVVLSMGAPGVPGSGLICLSVLLTQINVPVEAIGLVMGIDSLCGMFRTMSNCLGDVAVSTIVAKSENELDMEVYNS
ncbi:MAG: cation:dicarboxylase symporter family transporter [Lachnospiraceae bacterium]|nr:cation:dicarboxylase symporter family transporter [Lachnospiraceae bacterium]